MARVRVLKVESSSLTASFRYPRVQVGRLTTFEMPPPATIYGHLAGVIGDWFEPEGLEFAYTFQHSGKGVDLETILPIERGSGKPTLAKRGWPFPINVQCDANIQRREFLLWPELTLYLRSANADLLAKLQQSFLNPYFSYILGRSQDLATCHRAEFIELGLEREVFFADTLLPFEWRPWVSPGATVLLPSSIDYTRNRLATQERYLQVTRPALRVFAGTDDVIARDRLPADFPTDTTEQRNFPACSLPRGLHFWPVPSPYGAA
jgi:CRISPR-associated protein Cas5t